MAFTCVLRGTECSGCGECRPEPEIETPVCPLCGGDAETFYMDHDGEILGCDCCTDAVSAYEVKFDS